MPWWTSTRLWVVAGDKPNTFNRHTKTHSKIPGMPGIFNLVLATDDTNFTDKQSVLIGEICSKHIATICMLCVRKITDPSHR